MPSSAGRSSLPPIRIWKREKKRLLSFKKSEDHPGELAGSSPRRSCSASPAFAKHSHFKHTGRTGGLSGYGRRAGLRGQLLTPKLPILIAAMTVKPMYLIPHAKVRKIVPPKTGCLIPTTASFSRFLLPRKERFVMTTMTAEEKKLLQARHRLEEAQMRAKEKARKARTPQAHSGGYDFGEGAAGDSDC